MRHSGEHGRDLFKMQVCLGREQPRHRGFAGPRRAPKNQRPERARRKHAGHRPVGPEQVVLTHHFAELARTQFIREWSLDILLKASRLKQAWLAALASPAHSLHGLVTAPLGVESPIAVTYAGAPPTARSQRAGVGRAMPSEPAYPPATV